MVTNNAVNLNAQGTVYYNGAGTFSGVDASTAGFVLTSTGTGSAPSFQAASAGGGSVVFISSQAVSAAAAASFTSGIDNTYDTYLFLYKNISSGTNGVSFICEVSTDGGSNWLATGYNSIYLRFNSGGIGVNNITTAILLSESAGFPNTSIAGGRIMFHHATSAATCLVEGSGNYGTSTGGFISASCPSSSTIDAVRFRMSSGTITGTVSMYGVVES